MSHKLPPGPPYPRLLQSVGFWSRTVPFLERSRRLYGNRFTLRLFGVPPFVMHADPAHIKEIFTASPEDLHPGEGARILEPIVGTNSVILLDEAKHMEQRKLMLPAFHGEKMKALTGLMEEAAVSEVESWPRGESAEMQPRMQHLTLDIILRAVFGLDPGPRMDKLRDRLTAMLKIGDSPISLSPPDPDGFVGRIAARVGPFAKFLRIQEEADEMIFEQINERRANPGERNDILAMLLEARHEDETPMSDQEIRDELMTMLVAGHETTASSLAWACERLTRTPAVLTRLTNAIDDDDDAYLTATIQETLRRRPVLPNAAPRLTKREIEIGGWTFPPGVSLIVSTYLLHHDAVDLPRPLCLPARALSRKPARHLHLDPLRRRSPALSRRQLRHAGDEDRPARDPLPLRARPRRPGTGVHPPPQHHSATRARRPHRRQGPNDSARARSGLDGG